MANIAMALRGEITRLARKEIRGEIENLRKASAQYRSEIAALKRRIAALEQQVSRAGQAASAAPKEPAEEKPGHRFSAKGFKTMRHRLGLTAEALGGLLDVTAQTVYNWEAGSSRPRAQQLEKIAYLRAMGKREVGAVLKQLAA